LIEGNTIPAHGRITAAIILEGAGIGDHNVIKDNVIDSSAGYGVAVSNYACPGPSPAFNNNTISHNTIVEAAIAGIQDGGSHDVISYNQVCPAPGATAIANISSTSVVQQNVTDCTAAQAAALQAPVH